MRATAFLLVMLGCLSPAASAQKYSETIVVTAERIETSQIESAAAVTVFTRADLQSMPVDTLADVLRYVPGLQLISVIPGAPPMISSRGFFGAGEVEYLQLFIDGVLAGDVESGLAAWQEISVDEIERVEILRGPASSLYGDTALGGVVSVTRKQSGPTFDVTLGSFGAKGAEVRFPAASIRWQESDGFRAHGHSRDLTANARLHRGRIRASIDLSDRDRDEPGSRSASELRVNRLESDPIFRFDHDASRRMRAALQYSTESSTILLHASSRESEIVRTLLLTPTFPDRAARAIDTSRFGFEARNERKTGQQVRFAAGIEGFHERLESTYFAFDERRGDEVATGHGHRKRAAAYASAEWRVSPRTRITGGLRWDGINDSFAGENASDTAISPRLGLNTQFGATNLYFQASRAFKAPTLDQRFDQRPFPDISGGTFTISNPRLQPQQAINLETGVRRDVGDRQWEIVAYWMHVDDEIDFDPATFRYANIGRSSHRGIEAGARWRWGFMTPVVAYTWTRVEPRQGPNRNRQLKNIAEHVARATVALPGWRRLEASISVEHARGRYLDDANRFPLDDSTVADLRVQSRLPRGARLNLQVRNLTDEQYAPLGYALSDFNGDPQPLYFPAPGRSIEFSVGWTFAAPNGGQP